MAGTIIGLDFGTSTSLLAVGEPARGSRVLPIGRTSRWMPSIAAPNGAQFTAGEDAEAMAPDALIRSVKRAITTGEYEWPAGEHSASGATVSADDVIYSLLRELRERAHGIGVDVAAGGVRLGCPAMWDGERRERLATLAEEAGIPVGTSTLVDEPIAAAIAWITRELRRTGSELEGRLLVFDMGGGTLDVAVVSVNARPGQQPAINVLASGGQDEAGDNIDDAIVEHYVTSTLRAAGIEIETLTDGQRVRNYIRRAAREVKVSLSTAPFSRVPIAYPDADLPDLELTASMLEDVLGPQLRRAMDLVWSQLRSARLTEANALSVTDVSRMDHDTLRRGVTWVLIAGGMSRTPAVRAVLHREFPDAALHTVPGITHDEAIVAGLAETSSYERLSLHRPGFNFILTWRDHHGGTTTDLPLYEAYTPFYTWWQTVSRNNVNYEKRLQDGDTPRFGTGMLSVQAVDGQPIAFVGPDDRLLRGLPVAFGHRPISLVLARDGRIQITDGNDQDWTLRVDRWPVIDGVHGARELRFTTNQGSFGPISDNYYLNPVDSK